MGKLSFSSVGAHSSIASLKLIFSRFTEGGFGLQSRYFKCWKARC
jgi:hypothetical protein